MLIIQLSTGDLKVSSWNVGEKKALSAAETGIHRLMQNFDPATHGTQTDQQVDSAADPASIYTIHDWSVPASGPAVLPLTGYAVGGGQQWGQRCYGGSVTGKNTKYNSSVQIDVGMGYGPIEISTMSR
jgi:hypothetical protein